MFEFFAIAILVWVTILVLNHAWKLHKQKKQIKSQKEFLEVLKTFTENAAKKHLRTLRTKMYQLAVTDPYGNTDFSKVFSHFDYFIREVVLRDFRASTGLDPTPITHNQEILAHLRQVISNVMLNDTRKSLEHPGQNSEVVFDEPKTGIDYEFFCKRTLEGADWTVLTTPVTGDQGADLIATKGSLRVVIQCKFYNSPVGNKAVQEAYAAQAFQQADYAVVASNSTFTPAAEQLARTNRVFLLHHSSLPELEKIIIGKTGAPAAF